MTGLRAALFLSAVAAACGGEAPPPARAQAPQPAPRATVPAPRVMPVEIVRVSPETIDVRGGRIVPATFTVEYRIADPARITDAELRIQSEGFGVVERQPVPVDSAGIVTIAVDTTEDFGPLVRFRLVCPSGTTDWRVLGGAPPDPGERQPGGLQLLTVSPRVIRRAYAERPPGSVEPIGLHGTGLSADCTIEGERDGHPLELLNPSFRDGTVRGLLRHSDIGDRPVGKRYLEFGLSIRGPGVGQIHLKQVPFNE